MKERLVVSLFGRFGATSLGRVHCLFSLVFATIYRNNRYFYYWTFSVNLITQFVKRLVKRLKRASSTYYLYSNVCSLIDSKFDILNPLFFFFIKSLLWARGDDQTWVVTYLCWERFNYISCFRGQYVYRHSPLSLIVQRVKHLLTWQAESQMNTKVRYVLPEWPQFIFVTFDIKLLRQISTIRLLFENEACLSLSFLAYYLLGHWYKDITVKMPSTPV